MNRKYDDYKIVYQNIQSNRYIGILISSKKPTCSTFKPIIICTKRRIGVCFLSASSKGDKFETFNKFSALIFKLVYIGNCQLGLLLLSLVHVQNLRLKIKIHGMYVHNFDAKKGIKKKLVKVNLKYNFGPGYRNCKNRVYSFVQEYKKDNFSETKCIVESGTPFFSSVCLEITN